MSSRQPGPRQFAHLLNAEEAPGSSTSPAGSRSQSLASYPSIPGITCWKYKVIRSQRRSLKGLIDDRDDADDEY